MCHGTDNVTSLRFGRKRARGLKLRYYLPRPEMGECFRGKMIKINSECFQGVEAREINPPSVKGSRFGADYSICSNGASNGIPNGMGRNYIFQSTL